MSISFAMNAPTASRNAMMKLRREDGSTLAELSEHYGIGIGQVNNILQNPLSHRNQWDVYWGRK